MEPINLNHAQILYSSAGIKPTNEITSSSSNAPQSTPAEIKISPQDPIVAHDSNIKSRFSSMEEQSQHKTKIVAQWVTLAELESTPGIGSTIAGIIHSHLERLKAPGVDMETGEILSQ